MDPIDLCSLPDLSSVTVPQLTASLIHIRDQHLQLIRDNATSDPFPAGTCTHAALAALSRSIALIEGFLELIDSKNRFAAMPLIRLQLDSAMRMHACAIVQNNAEFVVHLLSGNEPRKFKDINGIELTDGALHARLTTKHQEVSGLYRETNGYVHLSERHLFGILDLERLRDGEFCLCDPSQPPTSTEEQRKEDLIGMLWASHVLTEEIHSLLASHGG